MADTQGDASNRLRQKEQLHQGLEAALNSDDEEPPDSGRMSSFEAMQKARVRKQQMNAAKAGKGKVPRSVSESDLTGTARSAAAGVRQTTSTDPALATKGSEKPPTTLQARHTFAGSPNKSLDSIGPSAVAVTKAMGKRKREASINQVPSEFQIFQGLSFYFFPNTDTNPARKLRIAKAVEFGATWSKALNETVTHVVVDRAMDFGLVLKFLKLEQLPRGVVVVAENYPAECISYKKLLEPSQLQFRVKGYELPLAAQDPASSAGSAISLELKPAGKSVQTRHADTPASSKSASMPRVELSSDEDRPSDARQPTEPSGATSIAGIASTEEFDIAIERARDLQDAPLDSDEEDQSRPTSSEGPATDDEKQSGNLRAVRKKSGKSGTLQGNFACMQKHTGSNETFNAGTVAILQQMADYYGQIGDEWRTRAYRKAISTLRNHPTKVCTRGEALSLPQIGERLATKIEEIAITNRLRRLDNARAEPSDQVLQTFMQVYGVGLAQANKWVSMGYTSLDELLEKAELSNNQRIGIEHYADFNSRIPRAEVAQHGKIVRKTLQKIDPTFEVIVGGSYRRGAETSGDIDCIITRPNTDAAFIAKIVFDRLVPQLFTENFLVAELAATSRDDGSKWHGASSLPPSGTELMPWRRIDFLLVPSDELGAALIYFTGNDIFNRSLRLLASKRGMRLNQRGLYQDVVRGTYREKISEGTLVAGRDEKRIFEILGVPWRPPEHRIC